MPKTPFDCSRFKSVNKDQWYTACEFYLSLLHACLVTPLLMCHVWDAFPIALVAFLEFEFNCGPLKLFDNFAS